MVKAPGEEGMNEADEDGWGLIGMGHRGTCWVRGGCDGA